MISTASSVPSASRPLELNLKREQNPRYGHHNGLILCLQRPMHGALLEGTYESFGADNDLHIVGLVGANEFLVTRATAFCAD
jgi:hypothetical protein